MGATVRGQGERRWVPTTRPYREKKPLVVQFLEDQGYHVTDSSQHGERREMTKGSEYPKIVLSFMHREFLCAYIHLAADKNIGRVTREQLSAFFGDGLCLSEYVEPWEYGRTHYCKRPTDHEGACKDDEGFFPEAA